MIPILTANSPAAGTAADAPLRAGAAGAERAAFTAVFISAGPAAKPVPVPDPVMADEQTDLSADTDDAALPAAVAAADVVIALPVQARKTLAQGEPLMQKPAPAIGPMVADGPDPKVIVGAPAANADAVPAAPVPASASQRLIEGHLSRPPAAAQVSARSDDAKAVGAPPNDDRIARATPVLGENRPDSPPAASRPAGAVLQATELTAPLPRTAPDRTIEPVRFARERKETAETTGAPVIGAKTTINPHSVAMSPPPAVMQHKAALIDAVEKPDAKAVALDADMSLGQVPQDKPLTVINAAAAQSAAPHTARQASQQIAAVIAKGSGQTTEIALNPEELGRVRLALSATETSVVLSVLAERPETQDLLRRHIETLAQEFRALGYEKISFSFDAEPQTGSPHRTQTDQGDSLPDTDEHIEPTGRTGNHHPQGGLDLRL